MRRVVVTGVGAVSPCGLDAGASWQAVKAGRSGIAKVARFDTEGFPVVIAGECTGFEPGRHIAKRDLRTMDRFIHLAMAAGDEVMASSGLAADDPLRARTGTLIG